MAVEASLIAGTAIGLSIAAPFGPASMMCVQRTLGDGFYPGLAAGLGIATVHLTYGILASLGASRLELSPQHAFVFSILASFVLMCFAFRVLRSTVVLNSTTASPAAVGSAYCGAIGFGFLNPLTPMLFAAASPNLTSPDPVSAALLIAGVFVGSITWWSALSSGITFFRKRLTLRVLNICNKVAGIFLGVMAVATIARTCFAAM